MVLDGALRVIRVELQDNRYPVSFGVLGDFSTIVRKDCCFCFLRTGQE